jgi:hypothetical protein
MTSHTDSAHAPAREAAIHQKSTTEVRSDQPAQPGSAVAHGGNNLAQRENILAQGANTPVTQGASTQVQGGSISTPSASSPPREIGGREGLEPTRYGDWEMRGRCIDF